MNENIITILLENLDKLVAISILIVMGLISRFVLDLF